MGPLPGVGRSEFELGRCTSALKSFFVVAIVRYDLRSKLKFCLVCTENTRKRLKASKRD